MNLRVDHVLLEAMLLAPAERSLAALSLLDSIQGTDDCEDTVVAAWVAEARASHLNLVESRTQGLSANEFQTWFKAL